MGEIHLPAFHGALGSLTIATVWVDWKGLSDRRTCPTRAAGSTGRCNIIYSNRYLEGGVYETVWTSRAELGGESGYVVPMESRLPVVRIYSIANVDAQGNSDVAS
jgi:hypothetical protein